VTLRWFAPARLVRAPDGCEWQISARLVRAPDGCEWQIYVSRLRPASWQPLDHEPPPPANGGGALLVGFFDVFLSLVHDVVVPLLRLLVTAPVALLRSAGSRRRIILQGLCPSAGVEPRCSVARWGRRDALLCRLFCGNRRLSHALPLLDYCNEPPRLAVLEKRWRITVCARTRRSISASRRVCCSAARLPWPRSSASQPRSRSG
jgi:hypothetical protein